MSLVAIPVIYPIAHDALVAMTQHVIEAENAKGNGKIRLVLVDAISR